MCVRHGVRESEWLIDGADGPMALMARSHGHTRTRTHASTSQIDGSQIDGIPFDYHNNFSVGVTDAYLVYERLYQLTENTDRRLDYSTVHFGRLLAKVEAGDVEDFEPIMSTFSISFLLPVSDAPTAFQCVFSQCPVSCVMCPPPCVCAVSRSAPATLAFPTSAPPTSTSTVLMS